MCVPFHEKLPIVAEKQRFALLGLLVPLLYIIQQDFELSTDINMTEVPIAAN